MRKGFVSKDFSSEVIPEKDLIEKRFIDRIFRNLLQIINEWSQIDIRKGFKLKLIDSQSYKGRSPMHTTLMGFNK